VNAFLSPNFVLPAIRYLENNSKVRFLLIHKVSSKSTILVGLFVYKINKFNRYLPFPHISAFHSRHSFLSGILADKDYAEDVVEIIFVHLKDSSEVNAGILFEEHLLQGGMADLISKVTHQLGIMWTPCLQWKRGILNPNNTDLPISKNLRKNFKRRMQGLKEKGIVEWKYVVGTDISKKSIDEFIRLEDLGWKGENQSSIRSQQNNNQFFREMIENFIQRENAFFTELCLNGDVISSTTNLISGDSGFAFKIGWDPAYAKWSPGILNEMMLLSCEKKEFRSLKQIDSCASSNSYINNIWLENSEVGTGVYLFPGLGSMIKPFLRQMYYPIIRIFRQLKHK
jgi:hypothetical protein